MKTIEFDLHRTLSLENPYFLTCLYLYSFVLFTILLRMTFLNNKNKYNSLKKCKESIN